MIGGVSMTEDTSNSSKVILDCIQCFDPLTERFYFKIFLHFNYCLKITKSIFVNVACLLRD